jgi:hypothetical protein
MKKKTVLDKRLLLDWLRHEIKNYEQAAIDLSLEGSHGKAHVAALKAAAVQDVVREINKDMFDLVLV